MFLALAQLNLGDIKESQKNYEIAITAQPETPLAYQVSTFPAPACLAMVLNSSVSSGAAQAVGARGIMDSIRRDVIPACECLL